MKSWQDRWCGENSLAMYFPELFRICRNKDASVADLMQLTNGILHWDVNFMRAVQD